MNRESSEARANRYVLFAEALHNLEIARITGEEKLGNTSLWGLAISGGGIRSATFGLGVLQGLAQSGVLGAFHFCATVSGGGYIGGFLQSLLEHKTLPETLRILGRSDSELAEHTHGSGKRLGDDPISELRRFSNYLAPNKRAFSGDRVAMVATYVSNTILTFAQLAALILLVAFAPFAIGRTLLALAQAPVLLWAMALLFSGIALATRRRQTDAAAITADPLAPPFLLALNFVCLSAITWIAMDDLRLQAGASSVLEWLARISNLSWFTAHPRQAFPAVAAATTYLTGFLVWLRWWLPSAREQDRKTFRRRLAKQLFFGPLAAIAMGGSVFVLEGALRRAFNSQGDATGILNEVLAHVRAIALGPPLLFAVFFLINLLHLGFAYEKGDAVSRERWARLMGRCMLWLIFCFTFPTTLALWIPSLLVGWEGPAGLLASIFGFLSSGYGAWLSYRGPKPILSPNTRESARKVAIELAMWGFLGSILLAAGFIAFASLRNGAGVGLTVACVSGLTWLALARLDENEFSMNGFYRNRLVRCYLAPARCGAARDAETGLDPERDDVALIKLRNYVNGYGPRQKPLYPLLCGAVNLVGRGRLDWQDRRAASFVFSPLFCGHQPLPDSVTGPIGDSIDLPIMISNGIAIEGSDLAGDHTLGGAMSISGAAISPNMGQYSSAASAFLLALFNARLGWWVKNRNASAGAISFAGDKLISEMLSRTRGDSAYAYVTDGGHFENLGIYELIRRRCRFVLAVDATADPARAFGDLANAVRKCRVDFGADIDIDTSLMRFSEDTRYSQRCAALGKINYPNGEQGVLLYVKPSLLGTESADILNYAAAHPSFPHEPTSDQFFDEEQFESYRKLGCITLNRILGRDKLRDGLIGLNDAKAKEEIVDQLKHRLYEPSNASFQHRAHHDEALVKLYEKMRTNPELGSLDAHLYPGFLRIRDYLCENAGQVDEGDPLLHPQDRSFRQGFYFMQELIQLMEGVYLDLDLDRNWNHPDNRGWMNLFRHWAWVPMFRIAWSQSLQTHGGRFVQFCERRLDMPIFRDFVDVVWSKCGKGNYCDLIQELSRSKEINFIEKSVLDSEALREQATRGDRVHVGLLSFSIDAFIDRLEVRPPPMRIGLAVIIEYKHQGANLTVLRVRDHLRRMGLGTTFMRKILKQFPDLADASAEVGNYGQYVGSLSESEAEKQTRHLRRLLRQARLLEQG